MLLLGEIRTRDRRSGSKHEEFLTLGMFMPTESVHCIRRVAAEPPTVGDIAVREGVRPPLNFRASRVPRIDAPPATSHGGVARIDRAMSLFDFRWRHFDVGNAPLP